MSTYAPSLLDKLLGEAGDPDPQTRGPAPRYTAEQIKDSVARDIELLLNTHAAFAPDELPLLAGRSLLTLGLPDLSSMSLASDRDRKLITDAIRRALADHDRRLTQVEVRVRDRKNAGGGMGFSIRGNLQLQPDAQPVAFDAVMQPGSQHYAVSKGERRDDVRATD